MLLEEKLEGRKVQSLPFLLSRNLKYHTLKNLGFCPNEVIHFRTQKKHGFRLISDLGSSDKMPQPKNS